MFIGPDFINCNGAEDITLGDLKVNCDEEDPEAETGWVAYGDVVNILNEEGNNINVLVYIPEWMATGLTEELGYEVVKGWYRSDDVGEDMHTNFNNYPIDFGMAIQVNVQGNEVEAQFAGAVKTAPTITDVTAFMAVANCSPKNIVLNDVKVNCDEEDPEAETGWVAYGDVVNILNEEGNNINVLVYIPEWMATGLTEELGYEVVKGWYRSDDVGEDMHTNFNNYPIPAAGGVQVNVQGTDVTVQIDPAL